LRHFADVGAHEVAGLAIATDEALAAGRLPAVAELELAVVANRIPDAGLAQAHLLTTGLIAPSGAAAKHRGIRRRSPRRGT